METVLVLGSTGLVGSLAVGYLAKTHARVVALARRPSGNTWPANVEERVVAFDALSANDVVGFDHLACAIGSTMKQAGSKDAFRAVDLDLPLRVATAAGVKRIALVSSVGADASSRTFYLRIKGELEEALAALPVEHLAILRPSLLLGHRKDPRVGEAIAGAVAGVASAILAGGLRKYRAIEADTVARALAKALVVPSSTKVSIHAYDGIRDLAHS